MNIEMTKLELINLLLQTKKEALLLKIKNVFEEEHSDWWSEMTTEEQTEIKNGLKQADKGDFIEHGGVMNRFKK